MYLYISYGGMFRPKNVETLRTGVVTACVMCQVKLGISAVFKILC
jgi:hypothetical protein